MPTAKYKIGDMVACRCHETCHEVLRIVEVLGYAGEDWAYRVEHDRPEPLGFHIVYEKMLRDEGE